MSHESPVGAGINSTASDSNSAVAPGSFLLLEPGQILVERAARQRQQVDTEGLVDSIKLRGQLNPVIVEAAAPGAEAPWRLVAGERRLTACQQLGIKVLARELSSLSEIDRQLVELEENIKRQDLSWQEIAQAVNRIHQIHKAADSEWTIGETARSISMSISNVSTYLRLCQEMPENPRVAESGTMRAAYNIVTRKEARAMAGALDELIAPVGVLSSETQLPPDGALPDPTVITPVTHLVPPASPPSPEETILQHSFLEWAPQYSGPKFNFIHCDFPYGIDFAAGPMGLGADIAVYDDSAGIYWDLLNCLLDNLDKIMTLTGHIMFWYSEKHGDETRKLLAQKAPGLKLLRHPLVWVKSDGAGIAPDGRRTPRHIYETALLLSRGDAQLAKVKYDAYVAPTDRKLHPSTKPEPMLKHFFEMLVDEYTSMLDPTCGSGAALRAAEHHKAKRVLGLETDQQYLLPARAALKTSRLLRAAERVQQQS